MAASPSRGRRARFSCRAVIRGWPWYYEHSPIDPNEVLLRTVPNSVGFYTKSMTNWSINPNAFEPAPDDVDGISLFREDFVTKERLASVSTHPNGVRVARISVQDCIGLNLSPKPSPDSDAEPGHCVIPEMPFVKRNAQNRARLRQIKDLAQRLSQIASNNAIYAPPGLADPVVRKKS